MKWWRPRDTWWTPTSWSRSSTPWSSINGRFEVEQFRIGRTNGDPSYLRLRVEPDDARFHATDPAQLLTLGCSLAESEMPR